MDVTYGNIEKLSDVVLQLDRFGFLKMNTKLGRKNDSGFREPFASGFVIGNNNYRGFNNLISIKREFDSYLSFEYVTDNDFFVQVRADRMFLVREKFEEAMRNWILRDDCWAVDRQGIPKVVIAKVKPIEIVGMTPGNKVLRLDPVVIHRMNSFDKGIRLSVNTSTNVIEMNVDTFMGLMYTLSTFDLYQASLAQINSMTIYQHPAFVKDLVKMDSNAGERQLKDQSEKEGVNKAVQGRKPRSKSFFDMDDLEKD
mgnify:CR=1 FL=1